MVRYPIDIAHNLLRVMQTTSHSIPVVRPSGQKLPRLDSITTHHGETLSRFVISVQNARLARRLDGRALLPAHKFTTTTIGPSICRCPLADIIPAYAGNSESASQRFVEELDLQHV